MKVAVSPMDPDLSPIEDVQGRADTRRLPINKVGIKDIFHPVKVKDRARGEQHTVANFNMYVNLPHNFKGTHMSRFVEILHHEREISVDSFGKMLKEMTELLDATAGHIEMTFPYFVMKQAPISKVESLMNYQATIFGEHRSGKTDVWLKVEELIDIAEAEASCEVYGMLKRPDEKFVTERAYDNPKFVEDTVRDVAVALNKDRRVRAYVVESENFESIHNHSAYAMIEHDKDTSHPTPTPTPDA